MLSSEVHPLHRGLAVVRTRFALRGLLGSVRLRLLASAADAERGLRRIRELVVEPALSRRLEVAVFGSRRHRPCEASEAGTGAVSDESRDLAPGVLDRVSLATLVVAGVLDHRVGLAGGSLRVLLENVCHCGYILTGLVEGLHLILGCRDFLDVISPHLSDIN